MKDVGTPIVFADSGTVKGGSAAGSWQPVTDSMRNQFGLPVELTEMRIQALIDLSVSGVNPLSLLKMRLQIANRQVTNGYVLPVMCGWSSQRAGHYWITEDTTQAVGQQFKNLAFFRCVFPRPTYLLDGDPIQADFRWETPQGSTTVTTATNNSINVKFAVAGRLVDSAPDLIPVPYVSEFVGKTTGGTDSGDLDLMNICSQPLNMAGLVGRVFQGTGDTWNDDLFGAAQAQNNTWMTSWNGFTSGTRLKIVDSRGTALINNFAQFSLAFGSKFWLPCRRVLPPRDYLRVVLEAQPVAAFIPAVSIVGWRNERR